MNYLRKLLFLLLVSSSGFAWAQSTADFIILPSQNPGGGCGNASVEFALIDSFQTFGINGTYIIEDMSGSAGGSWIVDSLSFVSNGFAPVVPYTFPFGGVFQVTLYTYTPNGALLGSSSQAYTVVSQGQALDPQFSVSQSASNSCDSVELTFDITSINSQSTVMNITVDGMELLLRFKDQQVCLIQRFWYRLIWAGSMYYFLYMTAFVRTHRSKRSLLTQAWRVDLLFKLPFLALSM